MDNELVLALFITAVGMTLLFLSLALFYGLLSLMTRLFEDRPAEEPTRQGSGGLFARLRRPKLQPAAEAPAAGPADARMPDRVRAALVAVALARAEAEQAATGGTPQLEDEAASRETSAWWSLHHQRRMDTHAATRRAR